MPRPSNPRKPEKLMQLRPVPTDNPALAAQPVPYFTEPKGIDRYNTSARVDPQHAVKIRNLMFDDGNLVSRLGTDIMGSEAASTVMQVVDLVRKGQKKVTVRFCLEHIEIFEYGLGAWRSFPIPLTGSERDFFAYTGWANKLLFSNGVDGLWEFDFTTMAAKIVEGAPGAKHLTTFGSRVVASSTIEQGADYPLRVRWSAKDLYNEWSEGTADEPVEAALAGGHEDLYGSPGGITDEAMGVFPFGDEQAWLIRSHSTWQMSVSGNALAPFRFNRVIPQVGTAYRNTIVSVDAGVVFASRENVHYITQQGQSLIGNLIADEVEEEAENLRTAYAAYDVGRQEYRIAANNLVWRYRFVEQGWTADEYPWSIRSLSRQVQGVAGLPIDNLVGIIDDLSANYPPGAINDLVYDRSFDNAMMFVPESTLLTMRENDQQQDMLVTGEETDSEILIETGFVKLDVLRAIEFHGLHGEYESEMEQQLLFDASFTDGDAWEPLSFKDIEETLGSEMFFVKQERVSRKLRLRLRAITLGKLRLLGLAPILVSVERTMASRKPKPARISILPSSLNLIVGGTQQLSWQVLDSAGNPISGVAVSFISSNSAIATVSGTGLVRAIAPGSFAIVATLRNIQSQVPGIVTPAVQAAVASVTVTPDVSIGVVGSTQQFTATVRDAAGNVLLGRVVVWSSSPPDFAVVDALGLVTLIAEGVSVVSATVENITGAGQLTVVAAPQVVATVDVTPAAFSGDVGDTVQLTAVPKDIDGNILSGQTIAWTSSSLALATVSVTGLVTMVGAGTVTITATVSSISDTSTGDIAPAIVPVSTVTVSPSSFTLYPGSTQALTITLKDTLGNVLTGRTITYSSSNNSIATVSSSGVVTGVAVGNATITATSEGKNGTAALAVIQTPVASITVAPSSFSINTGASQQLVATPRDGSGNPLTGRTISWGSSDVTKASVSSSGLVTAISSGSVTITATCETKAATSVGTLTNAVTPASPIDSPSTVVYVPQPAMWTLPVVFLDSRYNPGGTPLTFGTDTLLTHTNQAGDTAALQAAMDAYAAGSAHVRIKLPNGFDATHVRHKKNLNGNFWLYIEAATKPTSEGVKPAIDPTTFLVPSMASAPTITSIDGAGYGCVSCDEGAHHLRLTGIHFKASAGSPVQRLLYLAGTPNTSTDNTDTTADKLPQWIIIDRCWIDGQNVSRCKNGILAHTKEFACVDSVISGIYVTGQENHGINGFNALGPWKIVGNSIEAGSISVLVGGADPNIPGLQTTDLEIRRNHMFKRPSWNLRDSTVWDGISKVVKNIFELKWSDRVLVEGNIFENSYYGDNQIGAAVVYKVENSGGTNTTVTTSNVTHRFNRLKNVAGGYEFQGQGVSAGPIGSPLHRVHIYEDLCEGLAPDTYVAGTTRAFFQNNAATDIVVDHATVCLHQQIATPRFTQPILFAGTLDEIRWSINNSLLMIPVASPPNSPDTRHILGDGSQVVSPDNATNTLNQYAPGWSFLNNVLVKLVGSLTSGYPTTSRYTDTISSVGCINPSTGDFRLATSSPYRGICADGSDPGANMTLVNQATAGVGIVLTPPITTCTINVSTTVLPVSPFAKPGYKIPVIEPDLLTRIIRVTDNPGNTIPTAGCTWPTVAGHQYSKRTPWDANMQYLFLNRDKTADYCGLAGLLIDAVTFDPIVRRNHPGEGAWHPTVGNTFIAVMGNGSVNFWNPITDAQTPMFTTTAYNSATMGSYEGNPSNNGRYVAVLATRNSDSKRVIYVVDTVNSTKSADLDLVATGVNPIDWCGVSQLGGYMAIFGNINGLDQRTRIYSITPGSPPTLALLGSGDWSTDPFGHWDLGVDGSGNEVAFGACASGTYAKRFIARRLSNGVITPCSPAVSFDWHTSCRNVNRPGWGYVVTNNATGSYLDNTIYAVKMDGTQIERYARWRGVITSSIYESQPHACASPDGKQIFWRSNWGNATDPVSGYICDARNICP